MGQALRAGLRRLPVGESRSRFLHRCRGGDPATSPPPLTVEQVFAWADAHHPHTGAWPSGHDTGPVRGAPKGTTWVAIELAQARGKRGLPGGVTLAQLLERHRGVRNRLGVPDLTEGPVRAWADDHHRPTGAWPRYQDGPVAAAPARRGGTVDIALFKGRRGFPGEDPQPGVPWRGLAAETAGPAAGGGISPPGRR